MHDSEGLTHKSPAIALLIADCHGRKWEPHYIGYFKCFNAGYYYEAHDVLEELWLKDGPTGKQFNFYKGLIQIAGAFVHMKLHFEFPEHRAHSRRLAPAFRLLERARELTSPYGTSHRDLDLDATHQLALHYANALHAGGFQSNPWNPKEMPRIGLNILEE